MTGGFQALGDEIEGLSAATAAKMAKGRIGTEFYRLLEGVSPALGSWDCSGEFPVFRAAGDLGDAERLAIEAVVDHLIPWRSGPFAIGELTIDSEWISPIRHRLVAPHVKGRRFLDIGAGSGFFSMMLLNRDPEYVIALDPTDRCFFQGEFLSRLGPDRRLRFLPLSSDTLPALPLRFDTVLCLGVIYHHPDPERLIREIRSVIEPGGTVILESITVPGEPLVLERGERYAKMGNVRCIPAVATLEAWLREGGFTDVVERDTHPVTSAEQRRTKFAPYESHEDFLDPGDSRKTIEGHPAPRRTVLTARVG